MLKFGFQHTGPGTVIIGPTEVNLEQTNYLKTLGAYVP